MSMKQINKFAFGAAVAALALVPEAAHAFAAGMQAASGSDIAGQITQMANQTSGTPALIAWSAYIIGTFFVCIGIFKLKAHSDNAAHPVGVSKRLAGSGKPDSADFAWYGPPFQCQSIQV